MIINHLSISGVVVLVSSLFSAAIVYFRSPKKDISIPWTFSSLSVALWGLGLFIGYSTDQKDIALFWTRFLNLSALFISITFLHFAIAFSNRLQSKMKELIFYYIGVAAYCILAITFPDIFVSDMIPKLSFKYYPVPGILYYLFSLIFAYLIMYGIILLFQELRISKFLRRNQLKYLLFGVTIGFIGGSTTFFPVFNIKIYPFGTYLVPIYVISISYAIVRHRLMDIEVIIKKTIVFAGLFAFIFGIIATVSFILQNFLGKFAQINNWLSFGISAIVLLLLHDAVKKLLINVTDRFLFQKEYEHQQVLKEISRGIIGKIDLEELKHYISSALLDKMKLESVTIVGKDELQKSTAAVSIPIFLRDEEYWILLLGDKKSGKLYTKEDKDMLEALSHEISIAIENAINFQNLRQSQLELLRQENLKFVSVLVKGLAHEIFNSLTPLQHRIEDLEGEDLLKIYEMYENTKDKLNKDEELKFKEAILALRESTKSLKANARHIQLIVDTLNKIEKGDDKTIGPVDIKTFLKEVISIIGLEVDPNLQQGVLINQNIERNLPPIKGNPTLLKQVFINLYKNTCEAMQNSATKIIDISCKINESNKKELIIEFFDTGSGISPEILPKLFTYGATTKGSKGSGIGLNQCKAIIEKFGGSIKVESEKNKGTRFIIGLPVWTEKLEEIKNAG